MSIQALMEIVRRKCLMKWLGRSKVPENLQGISVDEAYQAGFRKGYWGGVEDGVLVSSAVGLADVPVQHSEELVN